MIFASISLESKLHLVHILRSDQKSDKFSQGLETWVKDDTWGAFHYVKCSGNFGLNSNDIVCFGFFRPKH